MEFTLKVDIAANPKEIYQAWLSSEGHTKMTGGEATASDQLEASFTAWDGYIKGRNLVLEPYSRIVQSWRSAQFEDDELDSKIEILLAQNSVGTQLTLIHSNVPESGEHYINGWDVHYFQPMIKYFSSI